jgi:hypothetical protein
MNNSKLAEKYLAKAEKAFEHAANCTDDDSRMAWAAIAKSFRDLAIHHGAAKGTGRAPWPTGLLDQFRDQNGNKRPEN